jgi:NAD(P)-dependent dehydrogenase (short-subunit alcohol dehydrogenase family)
MPKALIIGAGDGLSASLARLLAREGYGVALAARNTTKLAGLVAETGATAHACDAADTAQVIPLSLNDPVGLRPSSLSQTRAPTRSLTSQA